MGENRRPPAVLLAGGLARRMGCGDKGLRLLAGRPLLDHVLQRLRPQVGLIALNANGDPSRFAAFGLPVLADSLPLHPGPLAGVLAGMRWAAAGGACDVLSVPTDAPFLPLDLVDRLAAARRSTRAPIVCAASLGRVHPVVALWPVVLADILEAALRAGLRRVEGWASGVGMTPVDFDAPASDPFFNINVPDDLAEAGRLLAAHEG